MNIYQYQLNKPFQRAFHLCLIIQVLNQYQLEEIELAYLKNKLNDENAVIFKVRG